MLNYQRVSLVLAICQIGGSISSSKNHHLRSGPKSAGNFLGYSWVDIKRQNIASFVSSNLVGGAPHFGESWFFQIHQKYSSNFKSHSRIWKSNKIWSLFSQIICILLGRIWKSNSKYFFQWETQSCCTISFTSEATQRIFQWFVHGIHLPNASAWVKSEKPAKKYQHHLNLTHKLKHNFMCIYIYVYI